MEEHTIDAIYILVSNEFEKNRLLYLKNNTPIHLSNYQDKIVYIEPYFKNRDENKLGFLPFNSILKTSEKCLFCTYYKLFETIINNSFKHVLILESDVIFQKNFENILDEIFYEWLNITENPSVIFLGNGCNLKPNIKNKVSKHLYLQNSSKCTDSMLMNLEYVKYVKEFIDKQSVITHPIDHFLNLIFNKTVYGFWIENPIIHQGSQNGTYKSSIQS
jgi:glycosyl transferase family 25